jgi:molybdopterin converting factor small subunit
VRSSRECARRLFRLGLHIDRPAVHAFIASKIFRHEQVAAKERVTVPLTFHIPGPLRDFTGGLGRVEIAEQPATLADALRILWDLHPGVRDRISTEQGQIREHINIFIGNEDVRYTGGLTSPVPAHSEVWIVPSITGGRRG